MQRKGNGQRRKREKSWGKKRIRKKGKAIRIEGLWKEEKQRKKERGRGNKKWDGKRKEEAISRKGNREDEKKKSNKQR